MSWCTIESDPGVFTELISMWGVKGIQVDEIYDLESATIGGLLPVFGLVFLFKWVKEEDNRPVQEEMPGVFFAKQVISNACATQAILSILMNRPEINLGEELLSFKSFTQDLPSDMRGLAIGNSSQIRTSHNSFARPEPFVFDVQKATEDDDVFHFVSYVPINGQVYELDGLREGPIALGDCMMDTWYEVAARAVQDRIARYSAKEIKFSLLAVHASPKDTIEKDLQNLQTTASSLRQVLASGSVEEKIQAEASLTALRESEVSLTAALRAVEEKLAHWKQENVRRKHNYIPLAFNLLQVLAHKGKLAGLTEAAKKAQQDRRAAVKTTKK